MLDTRAVVHAEECISCNACASVCPVDAIEVREEGFAFADEKCIACGACVVVCPTQCISIEDIKDWYKKAKEYRMHSIKVEDLETTK